MEELLGIHVPPPRESFAIREVMASAPPREESLETTYSLGPSVGCGLDDVIIDSGGFPFCIAPTTPVLMADLTWKPAAEVGQGDNVLGFDEKPEPGRYRRYRVATVEALTARRAPTLTLSTPFGEVSCTPDSLWLEGNRFRRATRIDELRLAAAPVRPPRFTNAYKIGYLRGAMAGDGTFSSGPSQTRALLRVCDAAFAARFARFGRELGFAGFREFTYIAGYTMRPLYGVRTSRVREVAMLHPYGEPSPTTEYMRGWLAGAFDAEGSNNGGGMLRIVQRISNRQFWETSTKYLNNLGVSYAVEEQAHGGDGRRERMGSLRVGRVPNQLRFVAMTQPVLSRKWAHLLGGTIKGAIQAAPVLSIRDAGARTVVGIQTSTGTLIAGGFLSHDCRRLRVAV
jgi:hypothetical protein